MKTQPDVYCFKTMYQGVQFLENVNKFSSRKSTEDNDTNHKIILTPWNPVYGMKSSYSPHVEAKCEFV